MNLKIDIDINAPKEKVWNVITDIENSAVIISGIDKIEILDQPNDTLLGLKWKETRTIFGKPATETMWITEAREYDFYKTRAESNGAIYETTLKLSEKEGSTRLIMEFNSEAVTMKGKIMALIFGRMLNKTMRKLIKKDLIDIKTAAENI